MKQPRAVEEVGVERELPRGMQLAPNPMPIRLDVCLATNLFTRLV